MESSALACRFSRCRRNGEPGLLLSRVCKTASGNTVHRWKPLRARTPWNIVKRLGTPFLRLRLLLLLLLLLLRLLLRSSKPDPLSSFQTPRTSPSFRTYTTGIFSSSLEPISYPDRWDNTILHPRTMGIRYYPRTLPVADINLLWIWGQVNRRSFFSFLFSLNKLMH